ncbi:MAG: hypothetical protein ABEK01_03780 [Candidatus Nanohaloarchaea archaeon]
MDAPMAERHGTSSGVNSMSDYSEIIEEHSPETLAVLERGEEEILWGTGLSGSGDLRAYASVEDIEDRLETDRWNRYARMVLESEFVHDPEGRLEELEETARRRAGERMEELRRMDVPEVGAEEDIGQKRFLMYRNLERLLDRYYAGKDEIPPAPERKVRELRGMNGYLYKLCQEFLMSSSTMEKEEKLEKIRKHVEKRSPD